MTTPRARTFAHSPEEAETLREHLLALGHAVTVSGHVRPAVAVAGIGEAELLGLVWRWRRARWEAEGGL